MLAAELLQDEFFREREEDDDSATTVSEGGLAEEWVDGGGERRGEESGLGPAGIGGEEGDYGGGAALSHAPSSSGHKHHKHR